MNWVLILWYVVNNGVASASVNHLSEKGCKDQAIVYLTSKLPITAVCVEKR